MATSNLTQRLLTAVVTIPLLVLLLFWGPAWGWFLFVLAVAAVAGHELFGMVFPNDSTAKWAGVVVLWGLMTALWFGAKHPPIAITATMAVPLLAICLALWRLDEDRNRSALQIMVTTFGALWIGFGLGAIALLRAKPGTDGAAFVVFSLGLAWIGDTGGYFAGRAFGKHKLYEAVSPKKTIEGAIGGVITTMLGGVLAHFVLVPALSLRDGILLGLVGSVAGIIGDLGESLLKRSVGVKDSGGIVPGHGGMLDRIDAVLITAPLTYAYTVWFL